MTNRRKHAFATVVALAAALGAGSALAMAQSNQSAFGNMSAQSATTEENEVVQLQATDSSPPAVPRSQADENGYMPDQAAGSDDSDDSAMDADAGSEDSDNSAMSSDDAGTDSASATEPNTARAYGPSASSSSTTEGSADEIATAPAPVYESVPAYIAPPDSPRYTPETGDAQYGSKLDPVGPQSNRFNDATGQ